MHNSCDNVKEFSQISDPASTTVQDRKTAATHATTHDQENSTHSDLKLHMCDYSYVAIKHSIMLDQYLNVNMGT